MEYHTPRKLFWQKTACNQIQSYFGSTWVTHSRTISGLYLT